jgi:outer membrane protein OmpA-like peptidoglycan-associated protein
LVVDADALFTPGRWTLNPDGGETLSQLAPLITEAGNHPVRIEAFAAPGASQAGKESVAERRALTVRGWLRNHHYVAESTPIRGFAVPASESPTPKNPQDRRGEEHVDIVIDTCK